MPAAALFDEAMIQDDESARRKDETRNGTEGYLCSFKRTDWMERAGT